MDRQVRMYICRYLRNYLIGKTRQLQTGVPEGGGVR